VEIAGEIMKNQNGNGNGHKKNQLNVNNMRAQNGNYANPPAANNGHNVQI